MIAQYSKINYVTQLRLTLCNPLDCSPPGSSETYTVEMYVVFNFSLL